MPMISWTFGKVVDERGKKEEEKTEEKKAWAFPNPLVKPVCYDVSKVRSLPSLRTNDVVDSLA
jgi:hypothetical protein